MSLRVGASLRRRKATKRRANGEVVNPVPPIEIQPGSVPISNPANELEPAWLGKQGPLIYRTASFISSTGENPKQIISNFIKSGIKKIRVNNAQFMVSFYKLRTDQVLAYTMTDSGGSNPYSITIPKGNYSLRELQLYFKRELHRGRLQLPVDGGNRSVLYMFKETGNPDIDTLSVDFTNAQDLKDALGYGTQTDVVAGLVGQTITKSNGVADTGATVTSIGHINLALPTVLHICAPRLHSIIRSRSLDMSTEQTQNAFIATIPIHVNSGQFVNWFNTNGEFYDCYGSGDFLFDEIGFCYSDGTAVAFNGTPWSIEFGFMADDAGPQAADLS